MVDNSLFRFTIILLSVGIIIFGVTQGLAVAGNDSDSKQKISSQIYFDKRTYGFGQKAIVTLVDKNLNRHYDAIDAYIPHSGFVFVKMDGKRVSDAFTQRIFQSSFIETGPNTGIFKAKVKIPATDENGKSTKGKDLRITYIDINNRMRWHDTVTIL